jgi:hypothetical protein
VRWATPQRDYQNSVTNTTAPTELDNQKPVQNEIRINELWAELLVLDAVKDSSLKIVILPDRKHTGCPLRTPIVHVNFVAKLA